MFRLARALVFALPAAVLAASQAVPATAQVEANTLETDEQDPRQLASRLVAPEGLYPGIVSVERVRPSMGRCTGILIKPDWVLTEGYCATDNNGRLAATDIAVKYGNADLTKLKTTEVESVILHEGFNRSNTFPNSLALLKLKAPIPLKPFAIARQPLDGTIERQGATGGAVVAGWGSFFEKEPGLGGSRQRHLSVRVTSKGECEQSYPGKVRSGQVCAYSVFKKVDVCFGFAGAPLMLSTAKGRFSVVGMVSWGEGCARPGKPTVYTYLPHYIPWIESKVGGLPTDVQPSAPHASPRSLVKRHPIGGRIVNPNANIAPAGLFRYMVSLGEAGKNQGLSHFCGGTLLDKRWVLTAAHCVADVAHSPERIQLKVDSEVLSGVKSRDGEPTRGGIYLNAKRIIVHEKFTETPTVENDIALIEVSGDVPSDIVSMVPPLATPKMERELLGLDGDDPKDAVVIGWGMDAFSRFGKTSNYLHWTTVKMIRRASCNGPKSYDGRVVAHAYCAGREDVDSCQGDSGGPLFVLDRNREFVLVGVVSWGEGCGKNGKPGVYMRLPSFHKWILDNTK